MRPSIVDKFEKEVLRLKMLIQDRTLLERASNVVFLNPYDDKFIVLKVRELDLPPITEFKIYDPTKSYSYSDLREGGWIVTYTALPKAGFTHEILKKLKMLRDLI